MGVSRTGVLTRYLQSQICFHAFYFVVTIDSFLDIASTTIKGISNYAREINHRWRIKVIKFVNSTVKCNVNFYFTEHEHLKPPFVDDSTMNARRL